jgi:hypothetical protein
MVDVSVKYTGQEFSRLYDDSSSSRFHTTVAPLLGGVPALHHTHSTPTRPSEWWLCDLMALHCEIVVRRVLLDPSRFSSANNSMPL